MGGNFKYIIGVVGSLVPVLFAWMLGYLKFPDDVYYLDYADKGSLVLDTKQELTSKIKVTVGGKPVEKLSTHYVSIKNNTGKNFDKTRVEFNIKNGSNTKLLSSMISGPEDFSESSMRLIEERDDLVVYDIDYIDRASKKKKKNYFTISMLFAGDPPLEVNPISIKKGLKLRPHSENPRDTIVTMVVTVSAIFFYVVLLYLIAKVEGKKGKYREELFLETLKSKFMEIKSIDETQSEELAKYVIDARKDTYRTKNIFERYIRRIVESF